MPRDVPRTPADRRRAVEVMLRVADRDDWPASAIARYCGVKPAFVTSVLRDMEKVKTGDDGKNHEGGTNGDA